MDRDAVYELALAKALKMKMTALLQRTPKEAEPMMFIKIAEDLEEKAGTQHAINLDLVEYAKYYDGGLEVHFEVESQHRTVTLREPDATRVWKIILGE